jgi:hypothetical protein
MYEPLARRYSIHRLDRGPNRWVDTGTVIDERRRSYSDALWDGVHLYVASAVSPGTTGDSSVRVLRYSYDTVTTAWTLDAGFPATIAQRAVEAVGLAKDSTGTVWATFTADAASGVREVYVTHTTGNDVTWGAPYVLPVAGATASSDDISTVVSFGSRMGVFWGNQREDAYYFATHRDGDPDAAWSVETALAGPELADDHVSVRAIGGDTDGRVVAAVKTSLNGANDPLIEMLVRKPDGSWSRSTFGSVADAHTRPTLAIDPQRREAYVFASAPCCSGGSIYYKKTSIDTPSFDPGLGAPFIQLASDPRINNPTTSKQSASGESGILVLGGDDSTDYYVHNLLDLGGPTVPETTIDAGPSGTVSDTTATFGFSSDVDGASFQCRLDGGAWAACTSPATYSGLEDGTHTFEVQASAGGFTDPTPASRTWTIDSGAPLFRDGFETGDFSAWTLVNTGGDGSAAVQEQIVSEGRFAARLAASAASSSRAFARQSFGSPERAVTVAGDFQLLAEGAKGANVPIFRLLDASGMRLLSLYRQNRAGDRLEVSHSGRRFRTGGRLQLHSWSRLELRVVTAGDGSSTVEVRQDGALIYETSAASLGTGGVAAFQIGNDTAGQAFDLVGDALAADVWQSSG